MSTRESDLKNSSFFVGAAIIVFFAILAICAPLISPYEHSMIDMDSLLMPPSIKHLLGTDSLGRDLLSRIISTLLGLALGSIAAFYGKLADSLIMRLVDIMLCFPTFFLILAAAAALEPSIFNIMIIIGLTSWMGTARLVRAEILSLKEREFIQAEIAMGASNSRIIIKHLIPNAIGPVIVSAVLGVAGAILLESGLSFLGLGVQPPTPSWGNILIESKSTLGVAWWITLFPGLAIFLTILGFNLLADGLYKKLCKIY
jgi:peptide/nickel transport system permease protein